MRIEFKLTNRPDSALLMHHDNIEGSDALRKWQKNPENKNVSTAGDDRTPPWGWQTRLYQNDGFIAFPSENLMTCLRQAGARKIMQKQKTFKEVTQTGIFIETEFMEFFADAKGKLKVPIAPIVEMNSKSFDEQALAVRDLGFSLFCKRAKIGTSKHIRVRPRFNNWSITGSASITAQELTLDVLQEIFDLAGRVGLGDWRPGCKTPGSFGQFTAKIKEVS